MTSPVDEADASVSTSVRQKIAEEWSAWNVEDGAAAPSARGQRTDRVRGRAGRTPEMKFVLMIYGNQEKWATVPAEQWPAEIAKQDAFNKKYQNTGELLAAYGLADAANAKLVRRVDGAAVVTDGPYLETKEYLATFYLVDCDSEARALEIAADMPWADINPTEVWPIMHQAVTDQ
jgi:hypothetical protein